jgi:predicted nucleic acid-binding protein
MGTLFTTAITRFELLSGARTATQERCIRQLLDALPTLPLDTRAADRAARIRLDLEGKDTAIIPPSPFIIPNSPSRFPPHAPTRPAFHVSRFTSHVS